MSKADKPAYRAVLAGVDWADRISNSKANVAWEAFRYSIMELVIDHVPTRPRRIPNKQVWMNQEVLRAIRRKRRLWRARCETEKMAKYREVRRGATRKICNTKRNFEKKVEKKNNGNSRPFYSYVKGKRTIER